MFFSCFILGLSWLFGLFLASPLFDNLCWVLFFTFLTCLYICAWSVVSVLKQLYFTCLSVRVLILCPHLGLVLSSWHGSWAGRCTVSCCFLAGRSKPCNTKIYIFIFMKNKPKCAVVVPLWTVKPWNDPGEGDWLPMPGGALHPLSEQWQGWRSLTKLRNAVQ